jgi:hypothetical protein
MQGIRASSSDGPYFTPGFSLSIPLQHTTRIISLDGQPSQYPQPNKDSPIVSDTGELAWHYSPQAKALVTVETERSQALIGFVKDHNTALKNLSAEVENEFCSIILTSLDGQPISRSQRLLLVTTARSVNTGMTWNENRTSLSNWGSAPTVIEPVKGKVILRNLEPAKAIVVIPLNGAGEASSNTSSSQNIKAGLEVSIGEPATTWYLARIER